MSQGAILASFKVLYQYLLGRIEESHEKSVGITTPSPGFKLPFS
jgi:hypothetical protein